ncbi:uncharacterized protein C8A04DRAFT_27376 [Dichotomopilus funicola]|uniref:Uncharacterized protein n=1 Tax=Dichotomopilus funicola TaxID=1934379 RepID=A0AAN6ZNX4_9PEZI|nr:hypothetical protein C8A04DRAFT_27376 [Dichotomopilus funicola]
MPRHIDLPRPKGESPVNLYFIDPSCDEEAGGDFEALYLLEARRWARRAFERLRSDTDEDFARVFNVIFKTPKNGTRRYPMSKRWRKWFGSYDKRSENSVNHVLRVFHDSAYNWARTDKREKADVRIYAGARGLRRWMPLPKGRMYDSENGIVTDDEVSRSCYGWCASRPYQAPEYKDEKEHRSVIDICPPSWKPSATLSTHSIVLSAFDTALLQCNNQGTINQAINPLNVHKLSFNLVPMTILHEFLHAHPYLLDDSYSPENGTGG